MSIADWKGIALIIGTGDIGNSIKHDLITKAPKLMSYYVIVILITKGEYI